jgi:transcription elongation factor GreB
VSLTPGHVPGPGPGHAHEGLGDLLILFLVPGRQGLGVTPHDPVAVDLVGRLEVAEAAAQGDRSENAEYIYGKRRLREIDSRMRFLSKNFAEMSVIDPTLPRGERVFFGATVSLFDEDSEEDLKFQIVGPLDTLDETHISYQSPVGQALLGKAIDDRVTIHTPKETRHLTICDVEYI